MRRESPADGTPAENERRRGLRHRLLHPPAVDTTTGVRLATVVLTVMSIPVLPLRRCRVVINVAGQPCFFGAVPLRPVDRIGQILVLLTTLLLAFFVFTNGANQRSLVTSNERTGFSAPVAPPISRSEPNSYNDRAVTTRQREEVDDLRSSIDTARAEVRGLELELTRMDSELGSLRISLDDYKRRITGMEAEASGGLQVDADAYRSAVANHNSLVSVYNQTLAQRRVVYKRYETTLATANLLINEYNSRIRR